MAEIDLGKVKVTTEELQQMMLDYNGGVRLGKDENGKSGYYEFDESVGADTVIPFSVGGDIQGIERIFYRTGTITNMAYTTQNIVLEKKYKAIIAICQAIFVNSSPSINLALPSVTFSEGIGGFNAGTGRTSGYFMLDMNLGNYDIGSVYTVKYRWYGSSGTAPNGNIRVFGLY